MNKHEINKLIDNLSPEDQADIAARILSRDSVWVSSSEVWEEEEDEPVSILSSFSCDEILTELGLRFMNSNGIEFCEREKLKDVSDEIIYFLLETEEENGTDPSA